MNTAALRSWSHAHSPAWGLCAALAAVVLNSPAGPAIDGGQSAAVSRAGALSSSWRQFRTPDLTVIGNAGESELKDILGNVTAFRAVLASLFPDVRLAGPIPTCVVVFRDVGAFARFRPRDSRGKRLESVGGYFSTQPDVNFIVFGASDPAFNYRLIFHEYTHYVVHRNARSFIPQWLDEGLAEFYSTFEPRFRTAETTHSAKSVVGRTPAGRVEALRGQTLMPLHQVVSPREMEKLWHSPNRIGMFYAEAWALVHYVILGRKNPVDHPLSVYLRAVASAQSQDDAFREAFGVDVEGMDRELRQYVHRITFPAILFTVPVEATIAPAPEQVREADVRALQGRLLTNLGALDEAEQELGTALTLDPAHVSARVSLARVRESQDREDEAVATLRAVLGSEPTDPAGQYYLGQALATAWRHDESMATFQHLVELSPGNPYAWLGLSHAALALKRDSQADAALKQALQLERNPEFYREHAETSLGLGRNDAAATAARAYIDQTGLGEEAAQYASFLAAIAYRRSGHAVEADSILRTAEGAIPPNTWAFSVLQFLQGQLTGERFLAMAKSVGERTEAHTYLGFQAGLAGRDDEALGHFRWVAEQGAKNYVEYRMARNELARIRHTPSNTP